MKIKCTHFTRKEKEKMKKKMILLLTLLCAGQLYSMEAPQTGSSHVSGPDYIAMLPRELKQHIIMLLITSGTLEEALQGIRRLTETNEEFNKMINNPIITRAIIRLLVQKFNAPSEYIAKKLSIQGSERYIKLCLDLWKALLQRGDFTLAENLIKDGADIDYQTADVYPMFCAPVKVTALLELLNTARSVQATITSTERSLLALKKKIAAQSTITTMQEEKIKIHLMEEENIKIHLEIIESHQEFLNSLMSRIHLVAKENKDIFENDEQFNYFVAAIDKKNFQEAFAMIQPNTIMSQDPTFYVYDIEETTDRCMVGANFSLVMYSIATNQGELLKWLLKHKVNLELTMGTGDTALLMAINLGKKEIVESLIKNGANVNQQNTLQVNEKINEFGIVPIVRQKTPIHMMYQLLDDDTFESIFNKGLTLLGATPLIQLLYAAEQFTQEESYNLIRLLLDNGANPNMPDFDEDTPLIILSLIKVEGFSKIMKLLLDHGADPSIKGEKGLTALDHIRSDEDEENPEEEEAIQLLENAMKKPKK